MGACASAPVQHDKAPPATDLLPYALNELRNSLHALEATAATLLDAATATPGAAPVDPRQLADDLGDILGAAHATGVLVGSVITLGRLRDGTLLPAREPLCPRALLRGALAAGARGHRLPLRLCVAPDVPRALVLDGGVLAQLLTSALSCALKHATEGGGGVCVTLSRQAPAGEAALLRAGALAVAGGGGGGGGGGAAPPSRRLLLEVLDEGRSLPPPPHAASLSTTSGAHAPLPPPLPSTTSGPTEALATALERGAAVRGARAQRMALLLPLAVQLLGATGGGTLLVDETPLRGGAAVLRFALSVPYAEATPAEAAALLQKEGGGGGGGSDASSSGGGMGRRARVPIETSLPPPFAGASSAAGLAHCAAVVAAGRAPLEVAQGPRSSPAPLPLAVARPSVDSVHAPARGRALLVHERGSASSPGGAPPLPPAQGANALQPEVSSCSSGGGAQVGGLQADSAPLALHVLLVDDVRVIRRLGELYLQQLGCTFRSLEDGDQVPQAIDEGSRPFDAILLDIVMSRSDGAEVCSSLRKNNGARCPIIAMTGNTSARDMQRYYAMGFDVVLTKPFTRDSLAVALTEGVERRGGLTRISRLPGKTGHSN